MATDIEILRSTIEVYHELLPSGIKADAQAAVDQLVKAIREEAMRANTASISYRMACKDVNEAKQNSPED